MECAIDDRRPGLERRIQGRTPLTEKADMVGRNLDGEDGKSKAMQILSDVGEYVEGAGDCIVHGSPQDDSVLNLLP